MSVFLKIYCLKNTFSVFESENESVSLEWNVIVRTQFKPGSLKPSINDFSTLTDDIVYFCLR